jgi:hypothetical protein
MNGEIFFSLSKDYQKDYKFYLDNYIDNIHGYPRNINKVEFGQWYSEELVVDKDTEYRMNNFGFRDKNWEGPTEIIGAGCSMTYGSGVHVDARWTNILSKMINTDIRNISQPGACIHEIVLQIISHIKLFGNPKQIICLFPDPFRVTVPTRNDLITVRGSSKPKETVHLSNVEMNNKINQKKSYLKKPYLYEDLLPLEFPLYFSMMAIHSLEQICKAGNISLVWTSWDVKFQDFLFKLDKENPFTNFLYSKETYCDRFNSMFNNLKCHEENKKNFADYFDNGKDIELGLERSHPGYHWHLHVAEAFYKKIRK